MKKKATEFYKIIEFIRNLRSVLKSKTIQKLTWLFSIKKSNG